MIEFKLEGKLLILIYSTVNPKWVYEKFKNNEDVTLKKRTFTFKLNDIYDKTDYENFISNSNENVEDNEDIFESFQETEEYTQIEFILGSLDRNYYKIKKNKLSLNNNLYINKNIKFNIKLFIANRDVSIFKKIDNLLKEDIFIGGDNHNHLPESEFKKILKNLPNNYELIKYINARISSILKNYFDTVHDEETKYNKYINKKSIKKSSNLSKLFLENDLAKYNLSIERIKFMLNNENEYTENQWQEEITQIILFLYPKYIRIFSKVKIKDTYNNKNRELDYLLIDSNGNTDIVEIKKPFDHSIVTKNTYRDNHIPLRELSGTIMQIEKYLFYLNKWGKRGELILTEKYKNKLPLNFQIKITNPSGLIIMGRDNQLNTIQKQDFEVIKRKYKNIIDIITYDDLLKRLNFIVENIKSIRNN